MSTAEKAGRFFMTLMGIICVFFLLLPYMGIHVDTVMSGSMEPALKTGGIVFTDTKKRIPEAGDIITYQAGENRVSHRVIRKEAQGYVTKGDANNREDASAVAEEQIVGTVIFFIPYIGYTAAFIRQKTVAAVLFVMLLQEMLFLVMQQKGERWRKKRKGIYEK